MVAGGYDDHHQVPAATTTITRCRRRSRGRSVSAADAAGELGAQRAPRACSRAGYARSSPRSAPRAHGELRSRQVLVILASAPQPRPIGAR